PAVEPAGCLAVDGHRSGDWFGGQVDRKLQLRDGGVIHATSIAPGKNVRTRRSPQFFDCQSPDLRTCIVKAPFIWVVPTQKLPMSITESPDRRGRSVRGGTGLLERDETLTAIDELLDHARAGHGASLLIEGHAGMGKTRLYEAALDAARARGMRVLRAAGAELESEIAFGVAAQLLTAQLQLLEPAKREDLLVAAPEPIRELAGLASGEHAEPATNVALSQALFTALAATEDARPGLLAIDDLHWCDGASLEFVRYLLHRLEELPIAVVMTRRLAHGDASSDALE